MGSYVEMPKANPGPLGSGLYKRAKGPGVISRAFIYAYISVLDMYLYYPTYFTFAVTKLARYRHTHGGACVHVHPRHPRV